MLGYCPSVMVVISVLAPSRLSPQSQSVLILVNSLLALPRVQDMVHFFYKLYILCLTLVLVLLWQVVDADNRYRFRVIGDELPFGRENVVQHLSVNASPKNTGTAKLFTTSEATLILESPILTCSIIVPTTVTFSLPSLLNLVRSLALLLCVIECWGVLFE